MDANVNSINWFEISVADLDRAQKFYETIFDIKMERMDMPDMPMSMFPSNPGSGKVNGGLVQSEMHKPSADGVKIYLNGDPDPVSYTHLRAHETVLDLVCRLLLENKKDSTHYL